MEQPYKGRSIIHDNITSLEIIIPTKKNWFVILFLGAWLGGWLLGEVFALSTIVRAPGFGPGGLFMMVWLAGWTVGGLFATRIFLWNLKGKEIITVGQGQLSIDKKGLLFFKDKVYDLNEVKNIRLQDNHISELFAWAGYHMNALSQAGSIKFDYGLRTVRFGGSLDESEANFIIRTLKEKNITKAENYNQ